MPMARLQGLLTRLDSDSVVGGRAEQAVFNG
jgi:hypothetical protein